MRNIAQRFFGFLVVSFLLQAAATASTPFLVAPTYPLGSTPKGIVAGDFNNDGYSDIATGLDSAVTVLLGNPDGTFQAGVQSSAGANVVSIQTGDFNADGNLDLVVANTDSVLKPAVSILLGNGDGTFQAPRSSEAMFNDVGLAVGDFNNDGKLDVVIADSGYIGLYLGNGDGTLKPEIATFDKDGASSVVAADFNNDGNVDVAVGGGAITVFLGNGDGSFQTPILTSATPFLPLVVGDLNGDGLPDLIVLSLSSVSAYLGRGDGTFQSPMTVVKEEATALAVSDLNGDGIADLAMLLGNEYFGMGTELFFGRGDGSFSAGPGYSADYLPVKLAAADFNHDGRPDLAVASNNMTVSIFLGRAKGGVRAARWYPGLFTQVNYPHAITVDINNDANPDVVTVAGAEGTVSVLLGNGRGSFSPEINLSVVGFSVAAGDLNGDGNADLVVGAEDTNDNVRVLLGNGDGSFKPAAKLQVGGSSGNVALADFNHDGKLDLVVLNLINDTVSVALGNGDGTFGTAIGYLTDGEAAALAIADFDGDGNLDIAVAGQGELGFLDIFVGNGTGVFIKTVSRTLGLSYATNLVTADFNNDGIPDLAVGSVSGAGLSIFLGLGNGNFEEASSAYPNGITSLVAADFNKDGIQDLLIAFPFDVNALQLLLGRGDGTFRKSPDIPICCPGGLAVADLNQDGKIDAVISGYYGTAILLNTLP